MSQARSNRNEKSKARKNSLTKQERLARRRQALDRAMEALESRMLLSVSGFQPAVNYNTGVSPSAVAKGDFIGNGKTDLVIANQVGNNVSILMGNGDGTFNAPVNYAAGTGPRAVVVGDFNGDGKLDIAVADAAGNNISVLLNNGNGTFAAPVSYSVGADPLAIIAGDFTGHGKIDLAVANYQDNTISVLAGNGNGTFAAQQVYSVSPSANVGTGPNAIVSGDFNGDGKLDLATSDAGGGVSVLLSNGAGGFGAANVFNAGTSPTGLVTGYFNGDTNLDLAVVNATSDNVSVLLGAGNGTFGAPTNYAVGAGPLAITAGDFNNDGKTDLAVVNADSSNISVLYGVGDGTFGAATNKPVGGSPQAIVVGNFNGHGPIDLAVVNQADDNVSVLLDKFITVTGVAQNGFEGSSLAGVTVATFVDSEAGTVVGDYSATINWGDGTAPTTGTITFGAGHYSIAGTHTYADEGVYTITATVQDTLGTTSSNTATAKIRDAALTSAGINVSINEGAPFSGSIATFNDANTGAHAGDFTAVIQWGDGTSANGTIVSDGGGAFHVNASHTWKHKATLPVTIVISDIGTSKTTASATATIADAPLTPSAGTPVFVEGSSASQTIATFLDANPFGSASEFSAMIHWGDGTPDSAATIVSNDVGYDVVATHTYVHSGNKAASVSITSVDGSVASQNVTVAVHNAAMTATAPNGQYTEAIPFSNAPVAHFTDANPGATVGDFTATIDWGDGTPLDTNTTIIVDAGNPGFFVQGDHNYLHGGNPTLTVTINGAGGTTLIRTSNSQVLNQTLSAYGPYLPKVDKATPGELYRGVSGAFNTNTNAFLGVISASGAGGVTYMAGNGDGTFAAAVNYAIGHGAISVAAADFNADNKLDLVTANSGGGISIALGNGDGTFAAPTDLALLGDVHDVVVGDFNGDGKQDIATANYADGSVSVLMGNGNGTFAAPVRYAVGNNPYALTAVDLNGDGKKDLAVVNKGDGTVSVLLNNGDGTFASPVTYAVGSNPVSVKAGNLAGDGKIGLVVGNFGDNTVSVLRGNGNGTFQAAVTYATGLGTMDLALVDLYNTGKPDILTADEGDGTVSILENKGDGTFAPQMKMPANHGTLGLVTGDFNGDGKIDLVANSFNTSIASVFISNATPIAATEGTAINGSTVLMHFTDPNGAAVAADFPTVSIDWGDGHIGTGTVVAHGGGGFDVIGGHTYDHAGKKTVITTVTGAGGGVVTGATKVSIANAMQNPSGIAISPVEGSAFNGAVAHFADANANAIAADFTASIAWGDGSTTTGTVVANLGGGFDVNGIHAYAEEGTQNFTVTITALDNGTITANGAATISDAALHSTGVAVTATEGTALAGVKVATFTDDDPAGTATDYTATIHWGDGGTSAGTVTANLSGGFDVTGGHTYLHAGDHPVSVVITDTAGLATTTSNSTATVNNATVTATAGAFSSVETHSHSQVVANFSDLNAAAIGADFTATINWGDGVTADPGVITPDGSGGFNVTGTHTYARNGSKPVSVTINGAYGVVATTSFNAAVAIEPTVTATGLNATEGAGFTGQVAHFTDSSGTAQASDFIATIQWGDGNTSSGTVTAHLGGGFDVSGTNTYLEESSPTYTVTITSSAGTGGTGSNTGTATVADASLNSTGVNVIGVEGTAITSAKVATFTDNDPNGTATDYTATIHWGDGNTSAGTVVANLSGGFDVTGSHTYLHAGDKPVSVVITDTAGLATTTANSTATVHNDVVNASAGSFTAIETQSHSGTVATFTDANTSAVAGDFTATIDWGDGTTPDLVAVTGTGTPGLFTVSGTHTYDRNGSKPVAISINGAYGVVATTGFNAAVAITPTVTATNITPIEGTSFSGKVAHFTDASASAAASDFNALITWGDGSTSAGTVVAHLGGGFDVNGTHTYAEEGSQSVTIDITSSAGTGGSGTDTGTATISDAALHSTGVAVTATEGTALAGVKVATFTDDDPAGTATDYTATIHWGDGGTSAGTVTANLSGGFDVTGGHTYLHAGDHPVSVVITDTAGLATTTSNSTATVNNAAVVPTAGSFTSVEGTSGSGAIATFTDANTAASPGDFTATVTWGDGSTSSTLTNAVVISGSNGNYTITGTHQYDHAGTSPISIVINGAYGQVATTNLTATIHNAVLSHVDGTFTATEGASFSGVIGHFSDANPAAGASEFTASINWGDGTTTNTTPDDIVSDGAGGFFVHGTHTYAEEGAATVTTTITGNGGGSTISTYTSTVADAALTATGANINAIEGTAFTGKIVAGFTDADPNGVIGDFTATIDWGDGHTSAGTLASDGNGGWTVAGDHLYALANNYVVTTTINDAGGAVKTCTSVSAVAHGTISATGVNITAVEGTALAGTTLAAHFTDTNQSAVAGNFTATIDWGDGSAPSSATVTANGGGFDVTGGHTYNHAGTNPILISITGAGDSKTASATATVNNNTITITGKLNNAVEGTAFIGNVASFTDANAAAVKGDFTATIDWNDGSAPTTATINDKIGGGFNIAGSHTYSIPGNYQPSVTITGATGQTFTGAGQLAVADATLNPSAVTIHATEGAAFSGTVGTFQDQNHGSVIGDFTATIDWGDGNTGAGTITTTGNGLFTISGGHTWANAGSRNVVVTINDGGGASATISSTAIVGDATLAATGQPVAATEGVALSGVLVTTFSDANPLAVAGNFTATITWGDNSAPTTGTVTKNINTGLFEVTGDHNYTHAGSKTISVVINDVGGATTSSSSTATIANATLDITAGTVTGIEGQQIVANVAHFTDANALAGATDFSATINWGDNATSVAAISDGINGGFDVLGAHTYAHAGPHTVTVTINGNGGGTVNTTLTAHITNAALAGTGKVATGMENQLLSNALLASFTDVNTHATGADFTATIDWKDGSATSAGAVIDTGNGTFNVTGSHTYLHSGDKAPVVTLHGIGGGSANATGTVHVTNDTITATGIQNFIVTEGVPFSNAPVGHFTDANPNAVAGDFTATIDWGDFLPIDSNTTIVANVNGGFDVIGGRTYNHAGNRPISVVVTGNGGGTATGVGNVHVLNAAMASTGKTINATEGTALGANTVIAHFTDANALASNTDFGATIDWGDSSTGAGTIVANINGGFDVVANHTYDHAGDKTVAVAITGSGGGSTNASTTVHVANAAMAATGLQNLVVTEGLPFSSAPVAHFTDANANAAAADFTVTINWGDNTPLDTNATIVANVNGGFDVLGDHTYAHAGHTPFSVTISGHGGGTAPATGSADVHNAGLDGNANTLIATEGAALAGSTIVAHFRDVNTLASAADFTASIAWGDNTTTPGVIVANVEGGFDVTAGHTWQHAGDKSFVVTITGNGGGALALGGTAHVHNATLTSSGNTLNATEGSPLSGSNGVVIAHFSDANTQASAGDFDASINWGDGSALDTSNTIVANVNGGFDVVANHTYAHAGDKTFTVTVIGDGGGTTAPTGTVHVANTTLTPSATAFTVTEGTAFTGQVVAHFTDANANAAAGDFTATIFWGDASAVDTNTTIVANVSGGFDVVGGHTYARSGDKTLALHITGAGGTTVVTPNTAHVSNATLTPTGLPVTGIEGVAYTGVVATFTDANAAAVAGDFAVSINWGDGSPNSAGTIAANNNGGFNITGTHTYTLQGTKAITATVTGNGGGTAVAHSTMTVNDSPLTSSGVTLASIVNVPLNNVVVASFVDPNLLDGASHFSAIITWENGATSAGTIVQTSAGHYNVTGTHTYTTLGAKAPSVFIQDGGGQITTANSTINVAGPGFTASFIPFTATESVLFTGKLVHFASTIPGAVASGFTAVIDWGDGSPTSAGTVTANAAGGFDVTGSHTWRYGGYKPVSVRVTNISTSGYIIAGGANYVGVKPMTALGASLSGKTGTQLAATIATFTDANTLAVVGDFTASINWGDGTTSLATVIKSGTTYSVLAWHTYTTVATYSAKTTITNVNGLTAIATTKIVIAKGVASKPPVVGGGHGKPPVHHHRPPTVGGGHSGSGSGSTGTGAWTKPQQEGHGV